MEEIFLKLLTMSLTASILTIVVAVLRLVFKKAPKALVVVMWSLVGIRLICPVTLESKFSLLPDVELVTQQFTKTVPTVLAEPEDWDRTEQRVDVGEDASLPDTFNEGTQTEIPAVGGSEQNVPSFEEVPLVTPEINENETPEIEENQLMQAFSVAAKVWLCGLFVMLCYSIFSYVRIYQKVRESAPLADYKNVRVCDNIDTPFILGVIRPRIYLPSVVTEPDLGYVLAHEQAHLKRLDHVWKPLGFVLLSVYWFNPVFWLAYILLCRDIELACDEKVLKKLGMECKKSYSTALINCSVPRKWIASCPLAFGEVGVKGRIKSILNYKKPAFWLISVAIAACIWLAVSFLTDPKGKDEETLQKEITVVVGNEYAAYLDKDGKLHVLYDEAGVTEGVDFNKTYQGLGADRTRLVTIDEEGKLWASYPYTVEEVEAQIAESVEDAAENGGNYGLGGPQPHIMRGFAELTEVRQIFSTYPYGNYVALFEDGTVVNDVGTVYEALQGIVQMAQDVNGTRVGLMEDGTFVVPELGDLLRKKQLGEWPETLVQICAGSYFIGLREDGTVIAEDTELNYLLNDIEHWSGITKLAAAGGTVVGIKEDGTVAAVCKNGTDKGQCAVEDWTDIIAIDTNGSVTVGVKADGNVIMTKRSEESGADISENDRVSIAENMPMGYDYEKVKEAFLKFINHQAWLYPDEYPQIEYSYPVDVYYTEKLSASQLYLKAMIDGKERWFSCSPTKYNNMGDLLYLEQADKIALTTEMNYFGTDTITVPAVAKPEYGNEPKEEVFQAFTIDGETVTVPEANVTVSEELGVGIAFVHQYTISHTAHYNIYRSEDGGKSWFLVAEDYTATSGDIASILIPERNTVVCYFALSGVTVQSNIEVSKDGGATWEPQVQLSKPNDYLKNPEIGFSVLFGSYEQDGNLANGKEELEWFVLDKRDGKALLLSKYGLETMPYHDAEEYIEVTWESCSLRRWLNETFYRTAFTATERLWIAETRNENPDNSYNGTNGGNATNDWFFLLSMEEALYGKTEAEKLYFRNDEFRITVPTAYAATQGAWLDTNGEWAGETATWWLRTPGGTGGRAAKVERDGAISVVGTDNTEDYVVVRPAVWVDLSKIQ